MKKGSHHSEEHKEKIRKSCLGNKHTEITKRHLGDVRRGMKFSEEWCRNIGNSMRGKPGRHITKHSEATKKLIGEKVKLGLSHESAVIGAKKRWANPEYRVKKVKDWFEKIQMKPNKLETDFDVFLQTNFHDQWKYVGDGQIFIDGRVPDWININGKKQLIELFGDYFHKAEDEEERKIILLSMVMKLLLFGNTNSVKILKM